MNSQIGNTSGAAVVIVVALNSVVSPCLASGSTPVLHERYEVTASDAALGDVFGWSVAIDGGKAVVGAVGADPTGAAYLIDLTTGHELRKLIASDAAELGGFGASVCISGNKAIVGQINQLHGSWPSSAYLFDTTTGNELFKLTGSAEFEDRFGTSVAISDNVALISAPWDAVPQDRQGSAYLFDVTSGEQLFKLTASDSGFDTGFCPSVAIDGNIAIVSASVDTAGAAYLFDVTTGQELAKLTPTDSAYLFGYTVGISGNVAIVGSAGPVGEFDLGPPAAYLFDVTTGQELLKLTNVPGLNVAISGNLALIGGGSSASVFDVTTGAELVQLKPSHGVSTCPLCPLETFGESVAISGNSALVGAYRHYAGIDSGSAFVFFVPEPTSLALLASALAVLVRRKLCRTIDMRRRNANPCTSLIISTVALVFAAEGVIARADIYQWEYINPADPSQGKQQSTTLAPDGAGAIAAPGAYLANRDLTMAYLIGADLAPELRCDNEAHCDFYPADLTNTILAQADLTGANLEHAWLTGANLTGAEVRQTNFSNFLRYFTGIYGTGINVAQLYSTASYQAHDLSGIGLESHQLAGVNLAGQNLSGANFVFADLRAADANHADLTNANLSGTSLGAQVLENGGKDGADLTGANLSQANLTQSNFSGYFWYNADAPEPVNDSIYYRGASLTNANFTGAEVRGANFTGSFITLAQLYSTASYQNSDLREIRLPGHNLAGANLAGQNLANADFSAFQVASFFPLTPADLTAANLTAANLTNANFRDAALTGANLTGADARGANFMNASLDGATTTNLIQSDGHIAGVDVTSGASLTVHDYDGNSAVSPPIGPLPIVVENQLTMDATGTLQLVFDVDDWDSTISFAPGIPVTLGGTLELIFAPEVDAASQVGRTIDLFDWTGVTPTGSFTVSSGYAWDVSHLYTTGEVTLLFAAGLPGDFNNDGTVDAADYLVWRRGLGSTYTHADYEAWRAHFGQTAGSGASRPSVAPLSPAVPEPDSRLLVMICAMVALVLAARHRFALPPQYLIACLAMCIPQVGRAGFLPIYGGPTYSSATGGYVAYVPPLEDPAAVTARVNNAGRAIGSAFRYDTNGNALGLRAIRFDAADAVELVNPWTDPDAYHTSVANGINSVGTIAGAMHISPGAASHAVRWNPSTLTPSELGYLEPTLGEFSQASAIAINDAGTAVGNAFKYSPPGQYLGDRAVRWDEASTIPKELGHLGAPEGVTETRAFAINDGGIIVGSADKYNASGNRIGQRAVRWNASGTDATELGNLGTDETGTAWNRALAINNAGTAAGQVEKYVGGEWEGVRAVRWDAFGTAATELEVLGTFADGVGEAALPYDIGDTGVVVGVSTKVDASDAYVGLRAVRWEPSGPAAIELGNLGTDSNGITESRAYAVNSADIAVGYAAAFNSAGAYLGNRAVYWGDDGAVIDLNSLISPDGGWKLQAALDISDTGWIVGAGEFDPDGPGGEDAYLRHFLVHVPATAAIPEPATLALLAVGVLGPCRRRRGGTK